MLWAAAVDPGSMRWLGEAIEAARADSGLSHKALAVTLGITSQRLSHWINGREHVSLTRLLMAAGDTDGQRFWSRLLPKLATHVGVDVEVEAARQLFRDAIDKVQVRMLRTQFAERESAKERVA